MNRRRAGWVAAIVVCAAAMGLAAGTAPSPQGAATQSTPSPQQPTFRTQIDTVSVDVAVTDKQGRPVTDLTAKDFDVRENGKPQAIETFKLVTLDKTPVSAAAIPEIQSLDDQRLEAARDDNRLIVIYLDDYHTHLADSLRFRVSFARWVDQLSPRDLVAVTTPLSPIDLLTFAHDHTAAADAVRAFTGRKYDYTAKSPIEQAMASQPPQIIEQERNTIVISSLEGLCAYLSTFRDGRKTLLYVSEGLTGDVSNMSLGSTRGITPMNSTGSFTSLDMLQDLEQVFAAASRSNTLIYTIDPRGLAAQAFEPADRINVTQQVDRQVLNNENDSLRIIADSTGGRAILGSNDATAGLNQMLADSGAYYLLSYTSTEKPRDGKFHAISVKVDRKDIDIRARKGYWAYSADEIAKMSAPPKAAPPPDIQDAVDGLQTPRGDRPVRVWLGADRGADGKPRVTVSWEATHPDATKEDAVDRVDISANSVVGDKLFDGPVPRDPHAVLPGGRVSFDAPPGSVRVKVVAESSTGARLDTDERDLDVPDFTTVGPLLTTPMIFSGRTARDIRSIRADANPVPTPDRSFDRAAQLLFRFQAYGPAGTSPTLTMRLLNQEGTTMASLPAPTVTTGNTYEAVVSLGTLAPGSYVFEITATSGEASTKALVAVAVTGF